MKHAGPDTLADLRPFLEELRQCDALKEQRLGSFYFKSRGFLHFHEDPAGTFADLKLDGLSFSRYRVTTRREQRVLLALIMQHLASLQAGYTS